MRNFYHLVAHLTPAQLRALVTFLQHLAHHAPTGVGRAVYCGPRDLHNAAHYSGPCA